jgi:hypothetical protein
MTISSNHLKNLKEELRKGNTSSLTIFLNNNVDVSDLEILREQKLLLIERNPDKQIEIIEAYKDASRRLLTDDEEIEKAKNYADFTNIILQRFQDLNAQMSEICKNLQSLSTIELLQVADELLVGHLRYISDSYWQKHKQENVGIKSAADIVDATEFSVHQWNGNLNDAIFATARAINTAIRFSNTTEEKLNNEKSQKRVEIESAIFESLAKLTEIASNWNSLEYALDNVSYGEWYVSKISKNNSLKVEFAFTDLSLAHANEIGRRRELIGNVFGRKEPRWMAQMLEDFAISVLKSALEFYRHKLLPVSYFRKEYETAEKSVLRLLKDFLDAEDELLLATAIKTNNDAVLIQYLVAISLLCYSIAAISLRERSGKSHRKLLTCPIIPIEKIKKSIIRQIGHTVPLIDGLIRSALDSYILNLPTTKYLNIFLKPYIKVDGEKFFGIGSMINSNWTPTVRADLIKGGTLAKSYGSIWEEYIRNTLSDYGWIVTEGGRKIRNGNQISTDIDILAVKNELLLVIQVKVIAVTGFDKYEYWKIRKTIEKGAEQSLVAEQIIGNNPSLLASILPNAKIAKQVKIIQPLVVTNSPLFDGWSYKSIPVLSVGYLISMLRGARVKYLNQDYSIVAEKSYAKGKELSTNEFLEYIKKPCDWKLSKEIEKVEFMWVELEDIRLGFPQLVREGIV